jgi:O-antigen/teichoic acid export membrane protein
MSSKARKLINGSALRIVEFAANAVIGLLTMPFIIHALGDQMYGLWIFIGSFLGYYGLMDFGLNSAVQRYVSRAAGLRDHDEINRIINTALGIFTVIGIAALAISFAVAFISPLLIRTIGAVDVFRTAVLILGLNFALGLPLRVFSGILTAHLRYDVSTGIELVKLTVRTALVIWFLSNGYGIIALALITFLTDIGGYVTKWIIVRRLYPRMVFARRYFDRAKIRTLFSYSIFTFIIHVADQLRFNIDSLVIVTFIGLGSVTMYSIGSRLIKYFMEFMRSAIGITLPVYSQYEGQGDHAAIREKYLFITKISSYLAVLIGGILIIFGKAFIVRWVGEAYVQAYWILLILLIPSMFDLMQGSSGGLLYGLSKHKYFSVANSIEGVANLLLSIALARHYGIYGVALGTAIPMFVMKVFVQPVYICRVIGMRCRDYYVTLMLATVLPPVAILAAYWLAVRGVVAANYLNLLVLVAAAMLIYGVLVYVIGFDAREREYIKNGLLARS